MPRLAPSGNPIGVAYQRSFGQGSGVQVFDSQITQVETANDDLAITEHPVETGAPMSDHAYKRPPLLVVRMWFIPDETTTDPDYVRQVYQMLLALQNARKPFDVYSGKRVYANMLVQSLVVETSDDSEFALRVEITFRNVIMVNTTSAPNPQNQSSPERTQGTTSTGNKQLQTAPNANLPAIGANGIEVNVGSPFTPAMQGSADLDLVQEIPVTRTTTTYEPKPEGIVMTPIPAF